MTNAKRKRGWHRGVYLGTVTAMGLALSACGGGSGSSSATASTAQSSAPLQSSIAAPSPAPASGTPTASPPTASVGSVTLNWDPPTENVDDTPIMNLAGYNIHYGPASGDYTHTISVSNPGIATYVVDGLASGTYYFSVGAVNADGTESPLSSEISATVN